jgi:hypothetical protein
MSTCRAQPLSLCQTARISPCGRHHLPVDTHLCFVVSGLESWQLPLHRTPTLATAIVRSGPNGKPTYVKRPASAPSTSTSGNRSVRRAPRLSGMQHGSSGVARGVTSAQVRAAGKSRLADARRNRATRLNIAQPVFLKRMTLKAPTRYVYQKEYQEAQKWARDNKLKLTVQQAGCSFTISAGIFQARTAVHNNAHYLNLPPRRSTTLPLAKERLLG